MRLTPVGTGPFTTLPARTLPGVIDGEGQALGVTTANWLDPPYNRWGFRHVPDLCRTAPIARGAGPVRELPRAERDLDGFAFSHRGRRHTLPQMLAETFSDGFLVLQDGVVVTERYLEGMQPTDTHLLMSCSKSLTSILCGALAGRGLLTPGDLVTDHLPELAGSAWEGCRLQDILDMRAGNAWDYDVDEYTILDVSDYRTHDLDGTIPRDTETWIRTIGRGSARARQRALPLLLARHRRARLGARARRRRRLPGAVLTRGVVAHRCRAATPRSCSTAPASRSSRAASARRCAISRASG